MSIMYDEIMEQARVLAGIESANEAVYAALLEDIKAAGVDRIAIAARGTSDHCGIYIKYLSEIIMGMQVSLAAPSVCTLYGGSVNYDKTLVIAISQSGMAEDALAVVRDAKKSGGITVSVTNEPDSPLAKEAKYSLLCAAGKETSVAATKTFTAQMYSLALLIAKWSGNAELSGQLAALPAGIEKELKKAKDIMALAREYTFMQECFVLGRGLMYPIAMEGSLKMMETTYTNARGFAISDFQHGPLALVSDNTPIFVYCSDDDAKGDVSAMVENYANLGAYITMVTNDAELAKKAQRVILAEPSGKYAAPFHTAVIAQMFACGLAEAKRRTPDAPRNIKKVTITK